MTPANLCAAFQALSTRVWYRMYRNHSTGIRIREDGLTSLILQDLSDAAPQELVVVDFSPYEENRTTGADWEWWFFDQQGAWGAAVQAKCLHSRGYDFGYRPRNSATRQVDRLVQYCSRLGDLHPLYCLYNYWHSASPDLPAWNCPSVVDADGLWGCAIMDGYRVYRIATQAPTALRAVRLTMQPWHCLVCCPGAPQPGRAYRARSVAERLANRLPLGDDEGLVTSPTEIVAVQEQVPERIRYLMRDYTSEPESRGALLDYWRGELPGGVVLVGPRPDVARAAG